MQIYLVTAYRWGWLNGHQYQVYCGTDREKAIHLAQDEQEGRGGKYGCAVYEWNEQGAQCKRIAYYGAMMNAEEAPFHNWRIDYFQQLGHILESYTEGKMLLPNPDRPGFLIYADVPKPPQFVLDEVQRAREHYDTMARLDPRVPDTLRPECPPNV